MTSTLVRCWLRRDDRRRDDGTVVSVDLNDAYSTRRTLQHRLDGAIRGDGVNPANGDGRYRLEVRRLDTDERLNDVEVRR